jgi:hypothetical protein
METKSETPDDLNDGSQGCEQSSFVVDWSEPAASDPENPMSWSNGLKWGNIATLSFLSFLTWVIQ